MRKLTITLFLLIVVLSCDKDEKTICACGVEDPQDNIEWLDYLLQLRFCTEIYSIEYQGLEYIGVYDCPTGADYGCVYYDCAGNKVCEFIGFTGQWTCDEDFIEATKNKVLIYKQETNPYWDE